MGRLLLQQLLELEAVEVLSEEDLDALFALAEHRMRPPTLMAMKGG